MSPNAYAAAQRLARDPAATPAERANAAQRCKEHEAAHPPRQAAPSPGGFGFTRQMYEDLLKNLGNIKFDAGADPFASAAFHGNGMPYEYHRRRPAEPSRIIRPSAEEVNRYAPKGPASRPRVRRATTAEVERFTATPKETP